MASHGLKSDTKNPYQKKVYPFWRRPENAGIYSEATKDLFELKKLEFEQACKYISWNTKPKEE